MPKKTAIMTAIPYVNSTPHIGNILTDLAGDITARYFRMRGNDVFFQAGTDENGLKIKEAADAAGEDVHAFVDRITARFESIFAGMNIRYDGFVRTAGEQHRAAAQELFRRLQDAGTIYTGTYEGWYDVSTETFFKEGELVDGKSPDGNEVRWVSETNYFFKLSAFQDRLLEAYQSGAIKIIPEPRQNEVLAFLREGLRDMAISRSNPGWGIPVPGDEAQVIYVWFDALINYLTSTGWPSDGWEDAWPPVVQWLGKDILVRFHATLWPAMLMGAGLPVPPVLAAHAWVLLGGEKISKSKGNVVAPLELASELAERSGCTQEVAVDAVRYYLTATMPFENDSVFTYEDFDKRYNSDLANDLGNALNRSLSMAHKFVGGVVPGEAIEPEAVKAIADAKAQCEEQAAAFRLERYADSALGLVRFLNKYIDTRAPWALAKNGDAALGSVLASMLHTLRAVEALVRPVVPHTADQIAAQLGVAPLARWDRIGDPSALPTGTAIGQPQPIFPRLDTKTEAKKTKEPRPMPTETTASAQSEVRSPQSESELISIEDFARVQLRVARILEAEPIEGADKLLKLQILIGEEKRQLVAGIRKSYEIADLIGRQIVVVYNLKPATLRGVESQGMLLAAVDADGGAILLQPDREAPEGSKVR